MRELKFRAFHPRYGIEYINDLYWFEENYIHKNGDNGWVIDQCLNIKDKNNIDIYENDIVVVRAYSKMYSGFSETTGYIIYDPVYHVGFLLRTEEKDIPLISEEVTLEVTGNIHGQEFNLYKSTI